MSLFRTHKYFGENIGINLLDFESGTSNQRKINNMDLIKRQSKEQEKIFANNISHKDLIFRIHKELL